MKIRCPIPDIPCKPVSNSHPGWPEHKPLSVVLVNGGESCKRILLDFCSVPAGLEYVRVVGVAAEDPDGIELQTAREMGVFATTSLDELLRLEAFDVVVDLSEGMASISEKISEKCPHAGFMDRKAARAIFRKLTPSSKTGKSLTDSPNAQIILDTLPYRVMVVHRDKTVCRVNRTFIDELQVDIQNLEGKRCYEIRYGLDRPCTDVGKTCLFDEVIKSGNSLSTIHELTGADGEPRYEVITVVPFRDPEGRVIKLLECSRDVTERVHLEMQAQKSNIFLQNVIQSTVDGIVVVDTRGYVLIFNEGMEKLTGYSAEEIIEKGHLTTFYDIEVARENMSKMRSDHYGPHGKLNPMSMTITSKSGKEIPVTLSASVITIDGEEVGSVGVFTDMREVLKMRKDLEEAHLQLVQSEKIASVGRMAAGVAHEINNPLSGIILYAELLKEALGENPDHLADVQEIVNQTLRCKKIVAELLEFSRQSIGKLSSFDLEELIRKTLNLLVNQAPFQNIDVVCSIESGMPQLIGDMGQIQQVLTNLIINASDVMDGKGRLEIKTIYDRRKRLFIIKVRDSGPGVPQEFRDKIFDIFFTTKPVGKGTGLGLSISQNIAKVHGGTLSCDCPPEGGTVFTLELPNEPPMSSTEKPVFIGQDEP
jgi:two-component system, NtrC family, sensor kinase